MSSAPGDAAPPPWLATDSECGALIAARDWSATPLGPIADWPISLRTMVGFVLRSRVALVMLWGDAGIMLYNDAYSVFAGVRHPDQLGLPVREGWPEVADFNDNVMRVGLAGGSLSYKASEMTLYRNDVAEQVIMDLDYSPVIGDDGKPAGVLSIIVETTERVTAERARLAAEAALIAEHDRARGVRENMREGFVLLDHDFRVIDINTEGLRLDERRREDIVGRTQAEAWPATATSELGDLCRRAMAERIPVALEHFYEWEDGRTAWLDTRAYPTADGLALFYRDVTHRHLAGVAAAQAAERVQLALDAGAITGTWVWDIPAGRFIADDRFATALGLDPEICRAGVPLARVTENIHPDDRDRVAAGIAEALGRGGVYRSQYRIHLPSGAFRWIEASGRVELGPDGKPARFPGVMIDIEARRIAETERDRANGLLQAFIEAVPGAVYAKDLGGRMLVANSGTIAVIGKPLEFCIGRTDIEYFDDKDQGARIMVTDRRIMDSGVAEQVEEDVRLPDGTEAIFLSTKAPLRDETGQIVGLVGSSVDITARKSAEYALADALRTSDVLLHEVNHRVKNSLQIVTSLLMLQARQTGDAALRQSLLDARGRIAVIAGMHQRLYSTSQHDRVDFGEYVGDLVAETLRSLGSGNRIRFDTRIEPGIVIVLNQAVSLALVVTELVTNAIKYAFPGERTGKVHLVLERHADTIVLSVADDGVGLPDDFDPAGRTSLGMKIVTALVRQVRGKMTIGSANPGALFKIEIPAAEIQ